MHFEDVMAFLLDQTPDLPLIPLPNLVADPYQGAVLESATQTRVVQRRLPFDQSYELRYSHPPGGSWVFAWTQDAPPLARFLNVLVEVDPDFFYRDFFAQLNMRGRAATLIQQAHAEIADSPYILFTRTFSLE